MPKFWLANISLMCNMYIHKYIVIYGVSTVYLGGEVWIACYSHRYTYGDHEQRQRINDAG